MASCAACGSLLLFFKKRSGGLQFCNSVCVENGKVAIAAQRIPESMAMERARQLQRSTCPSCGSHDSVDVFTTHTVWSALVVTSWKSTPALSCKRCAVKSQLYATLAGVLAGWWGFPWGPIVTPIQLFRNILGMFQGIRSDAPSPSLLRIARTELASEALNR